MIQREVAPQVSVPAHPIVKEASGQGSGPVYLTVREVAQMLRVSVASLRRWYKSGVGPKCYRVGDAVRYLSTDVHAFVQSCPVSRN